MIVFKSIGVNEWQVLLDLHVLVLIDMVILLWNAEVDVGWFNPAVDQTLDGHVRVKSATINDTVGLASVISESSHERAVLGEEIVQLGIIN